MAENWVITYFFYRRLISNLNSQIFFRDQFIFLENNYGKIVGRIKDMIIRGGENLFPKEIEDFLNTHPDILEAHVCYLLHLIQQINHLFIFLFR